MNAFAGYMLKERLAQGSTSHVFLARRVDAPPQEPDVVIKSLQSRFIETGLASFRQEAAICISLRHPNIIKGIESGFFQGRHFLVLEFVDGPNMAQVSHAAMAAGLRISIPLSLFVVGAALRGLEHAHRATSPTGEPLGIIHRDVSPDNIFTTSLGGVKLGDFGIAKYSRTEQFTDPNLGIRGKLSYLPPERLRGEPFDARADQFSAALVLWEFLTGQAAYQGKDLEFDLALMQRVRDADIPPPRKVVSEIPRKLEDAVMKALDVNPRNRFKSCGEFADTLELVASRELLQAGPMDLTHLLMELFPQRFLRHHV